MGCRPARAEIKGGWEKKLDRFRSRANRAQSFAAPIVRFSPPPPSTLEKGATDTNALCTLNTNVSRILRRRDQALC